MRVIAALVFFLWFCPLALADTITMSQPLAFGKFATVDNSGQFTIVMSPGGIETYTPGKTFPITAGQQAVFQLTNFPPSTLLAVSAADTTLTSLRGGPSFDIINFIFLPAA